jgi:hypothetical protein
MNVAGPRAGAGMFGLTFGVVLATRLPFLGPGYGVDSDAWRVADTATTMARTHVYGASRFPGHPVQEIASALLVAGGPLALNGATAVLSACGAGGFALALRRRHVARPWAAALALALTPVVYLNSVNAMDYVWAMSLITLAMWLASAARPWAAGAALGLAIGCRITSGAALVPLALLLAGGRSWREARVDLVRVAVAALGVGLLAFSPVLLTYGRRWLTVYEHGPTPWLYVVKGASVDVWGVPGVLALGGAGLVLAARGGRGAGVWERREWAAAVAAVALFGAAYLRLPHEGAYLLPAIPFVLLALARSLPPRAALAVCAALASSSFLVKVSEPGKADDPGAGPASVRVRWMAHPFRVDVRGPILWDHARRIAGVAFRARARAALAALPRPAVVVAHEWRPGLTLGVREADTAGVTIAYLLDPSAAAAAQARHVPIYLMPGAAGEERDRFGVDLERLGARALPLDAGPR